MRLYDIHHRFDRRSSRDRPCLKPGRRAFRTIAKQALALRRISFAQAAVLAPSCDQPSRYRRPPSTLAFLTQSFRPCGPQPICAEIDMTARQNDLPACPSCNRSLLRRNGGIATRPDFGCNVRDCPSCADGWLTARRGKFGAFLGCVRHPACPGKEDTNPKGHRRSTKQAGQAWKGRAQGPKRHLLEHGGGNGPITAARTGASQRTDQMDRSKGREAVTPLIRKEVSSPCDAVRQVRIRRAFA